MCNFPSNIHDLNNWICVWYGCYIFPSLVIPVEDSNNSDTNICTTIICMPVNYYHTIQWMTDKHFKKTKHFQCAQSFWQQQQGQNCTYKRTYLIETSIANFHEKLCITVIWKLGFHFSHMCILGHHQCDKEHNEVFKHICFYQ